MLSSSKVGVYAARPAVVDNKRETVNPIMIVLFFIVFSPFFQSNVHRVEVDKAIVKSRFALKKLIKTILFSKQEFFSFNDELTH